MKKANYNKTGTEELVRVLKDKREALRLFRFGAAGSKTRNTKEGRNIRKDIARALTVLNASRKINK